MGAVGRMVTALGLLMALSVHPVMAQAVDPQLCVDAQQQVDYLQGDGAFVETEGLRNGVDVLANDIILRDAVCTTSGDASPPVGAPSTRSADDITACLPMSSIHTLLGQPAKFHAGDDAQHANFIGPTGATLQIERALSDGATVYHAHLDAGEAQPGWQLADIQGLGDKAFAANRGGDSRSLVVLEGDTAWLLHMDGVPAARGFPQVGRIAKAMLDACP
jgi:hypothetical protein